MNNLFNKLLTVSLFSFILISGLNAQKFGHINSQQLLLDSPAVKAADTTLEAYQKTLMSQGEILVADFEAEYNKYMTDVNANTLSPVQRQSREGVLSEKQQGIQKYEQEMQQKMGMKREELYKPIIDKINVAIEAVGKDGNYTMIFDSATGALLHAVDSENILDQVKMKLN